jgi:Domain of unknown function (DUF4129)
MQATGLRTVAAVTVLTTLVCIVAVAGNEPLRGTPGEPEQPAPQEPEARVLPPPEFPVPGALPPEVFVIEPEDDGPPPWLRWAVAAVGLAGVLAGAVLLVRELRRRGGRRRRRRDVRPAAPEAAAAQPSEEEAEAARRAVDAALTRLGDSADPRAAVVEAYARMEQVLAERELGRRSPEAPREYLERVLRERGMPEQSLITLTALFEEARFSLHPIPESMPLRAAGELEKARRALA